MNKILSLAFLLGFCLSAVRADQAASAPAQPAETVAAPAPTMAKTPPPSRESVERLIDALDLKKQLDAFYSQANAMIGMQLSQPVKGAPPTADDKAAREATHDRLIAKIKARVSWGKVEEFYIDGFSKGFTQEEIDGLVSFFESPLGKAYAAKAPEIMQQSNHKISAVIRPVMQEVMMEVEKVAGPPSPPGGPMPGGTPMLMKQPAPPPSGVPPGAAGPPAP